MPGSAIISPGLLGDSLIAVVDAARQVAQDLGFSQYTVSTVLVTPAPRRAGAVNPTVTETFLAPSPRLQIYKADSDLGLRDEPCGLDEAGMVVMDRLSLTYTEDEITGKSLPTNSEFFWKIVDAHGQGTCERYFTIAKPPFPDRECCPGWIVWLRRAEGPSNV